MVFLGSGVARQRILRSDECNETWPKCFKWDCRIYLQAKLEVSYLPLEKYDEAELDKVLKLLTWSVMAGLTIGEDRKLIARIAI
jgi:hypothetical protein